MDFIAQEAVEGLRMSWNAWPQARLEASRLMIPLGAVLTPLKASVPLSPWRELPRLRLEACAAGYRRPASLAVRAGALQGVSLRLERLLCSRLSRPPVDLSLLVSR